jgi:hypothetical protein
MEQYTDFTIEFITFKMSDSFTVHALNVIPFKPIKITVFTPLIIPKLTNAEQHMRTSPNLLKPSGNFTYHQV